MFGHDAVRPSMSVAHAQLRVYSPRPVSHLDLRDHDLLGVASRADDATPAGRAPQHAHTLVDGVEDGGVIPVLRGMRNSHLFDVIDISLHELSLSFMRQTRKHPSRLFIVNNLNECYKSGIAMKTSR